METYIIRICRRDEEGETTTFAGTAEEVGKGRKVRFSDSDGLLKILKLEKGQGQRKKSAKRGEK